MLDFREELSKIKEEKMRSEFLRAKAEEILKEVLSYFNKVSVEQLCKGTELSFFLGINDVLYIDAKYDGNNERIYALSLDKREDIFIIYKILEENFNKKGYPIDKSEDSQFYVIIKT